MLEAAAEQFFFNEGVLTVEQLSRLAQRRTRTGAGFIAAVLEERLLPFGTVAALLKRFARIDAIDMTGLAVEADIAKTLGHFLLLKHTCLPVKKEGGRLWVAMRDPLCGTAAADLSDISGLLIEPLLAARDDILFHINALFGQEERYHLAAQFTPDLNPSSPPETEFLARLENAPAVRLINSLIETAVLNNASDIHIEPYKQHLRARFRVDGQLTAYDAVDATLLPNIVSRLKVLSGLDIAEKRMPQDGRFTLTVYGKKVDFRLSTMPTLGGEKAVLRLLYGHTTRLHKNDLGFFPEDLHKLETLFGQPYGAIFITGPTGSGKTTTLTGFMAGLNTDNINITTVEDPVENPLPGVNHMNIEPAAGLDFANALKYILRQDPDIIMVGEIRDAETARVAVQAALTGHLVLSTLHTNDAAGVIERLVDMGVKPYLAAAALSGVIAQRLVRRICARCAAPHILTEEETRALQVPADSPAFGGSGCVHCNHTGYRGRFALYEYFIMDDGLRRRMSEDAGRFAADLRGRKHDDLRVNGIRNMRAGHTTASEIIRVLYHELQAEAM